MFPNMFPNKNTEVSISSVSVRAERHTVMKIERELRYLRRKMASLASIPSADFGLNSNTLSIIQKHHKRSDKNNDENNVLLK